MRTDPVPSHSIDAVSRFEAAGRKQGHMRDFLKSFIHDESGAAAAEYALVLASVGAGIAIAGRDLSAAISLAITTFQSYL